MVVVNKQTSLAASTGNDQITSRSSRDSFAPSSALLLASLTVLGAALRLFHLGAKSLWIDEAASVALAQMPWRKFAWVWWFHEGNMTAYYLLLRPWLHLGQSEFWIRLLSVLFGIAAIPAMFFLVRRLTNSTTALVASALLVVNPAHVYYSQEARSYSLAIFLVLLMSFFFVRAVQERRSRDWVWWVVWGVLAVYAHYFAALVLVAQAVSMLLLPREQAQWKRLFIGSAAILLFALPGISFVVLRGHRIELPWIPDPTPKEIVHLWMFLSGSGLKFVLYVVLWAAGLLAAVRTWRRTGQSPATWAEGLVVLWTLLPVLITIAASQRHSVFAQKYLLICLPATILLASIGTAAFRAKFVGPALIVVLCALSVATDIEAARKPREDWRSATQAILSAAQPGDAIVFYPFYSRVAFDYYSQRYTAGSAAFHMYAPPFYGNGDDAEALQRALASSDPGFHRVWVVLQGPNARVEDLAQRDPITASALQARFGDPTVRQFKDLAVLEFQP